MTEHHILIGIAIVVGLILVVFSYWSVYLFGWGAGVEEAAVASQATEGKLKRWWEEVLESIKDGCW